MVSEAAYRRLSDARREDESFTDIILRIAPPPPLRTCGDLLEYVKTATEPLIPPEHLRYLKAKKQNPKRSPRTPRHARR